MNLYDQTWITPPSSTENKQNSYFYEYVKPQESTIPLPHEDFTPYQQNYDQVDDFLTQTLSSLQELDIPVGETSTNSSTSNAFAQNHYNNSVQPGAIRGHKKQPSGTAIFGFASHNKTLSIPGLPQGIKQVGKSNDIGIAPTQIYSQAQPPQQPPQQQQPILYQKPQDIAATNSRQPYQQFQPIPAPQQFHHPPQPSQIPQPPTKKTDDFIITNKAPGSYKFPPEPSAPQPHQHQRVQQTVAVPVEYLQRITNYIKSREDLDMNKFLDYNYDYSQMSNAEVMRRSVSPNPPVDISPVLKQTEVSQPQPQPQQPSTSDSTEVNTPVHTPTEQQLPQSAPQQQEQNPLSHAPQIPQPNSAIGLGIRFENNVKKDFESPESEFSEVPKTPSPILRSQAKFSSEQRPKNELNWTPVIIGDKSLPMMKRKPQDKASTLPPGEIDHYVIGPREDKTYVCGFKDCGKLFTRRYNVRSHVQTHLSDRPFVCDFDGCKKAFVRQHDLTRHKKIHEEFEFNCPCGKKFSRHDALYRHRIRMICVGGIKEDDHESALMNSSIKPTSSSIASSSNSSIKKTKKKITKPIKISNDQVAKRLEFDLMKYRKSASPISTSSMDESDNVFLEQQKGEAKPKSCNLDIHSSQTPVGSSPSENVFLNDLNFGFDNSYDDYKF